jgi:hypothetical protein
MKERGVIRETINAAEEVNISAHDTAQTVKESVSKKPPSELDTKNNTEKSTKTRTKQTTSL